MNRANAPFLIALATILAASACLVTLPAPAPVAVTPAPDLALTGKAQTLTAAPTATFTATQILATDTPKITLTPFPSITPLPSATPTFTETPFGYFETFTPVPPSVTVQATVETPDPVEGFSNERGSDYACKLVGKFPPDWTVLPARSMSKASWTLVNIGRKTWDDMVAVEFIEGSRIGTEKKYALVKDVKPGLDIKPTITIFTPKESGHYRSVWGLRSIKTGRLFCTFTIKIIVQ
jgi:hypothetical protein